MTYVAPSASQQQAIHAISHSFGGGGGGLGGGGEPFWHYMTQKPKDAVDWASPQLHCLTTRNLALGILSWLEQAAADSCKRLKTRSVACTLAATLAKARVLLRYWSTACSAEAVLQFETCAESHARQI